MKAIFNSLIFLCFFLFSCKKDKKIDNSNVTFPLTIYTNSLNLKSPFKLYTKDGEITTPLIKNKFKTSTDFFSLENELLDSRTNLTFLSPDTALFNESTVKFSVVKNQDQFLFYSTSTFPNDNKNPIYELVKYTSEKIPVASENGFIYLTKEVKVGNGTYNNLKISILSYLLKRGDNNRYSIQSGTLLNEFDSSNVLLKLKAKDTLAVQEYTLNLKNK